MDSAKDYAITCCSTVDLPAAHLRARDIQWVSFYFIMAGQEHPDDLGQTMPPEAFYRQIAQGAMPTTSQVNIGQFVEFFEPILRSGRDILHISLSSGISGVIQSARSAREELLRDFPDRRILIVDSLGASSGYGMLVDTAADLRDSGMDMDAVHGRLEGLKLNLHHWFFSTDLQHYRRGGRISATSAAMGTLLGICPLLNVNIEGKLTPRSRHRGKNRVSEEMVHMMEAHAQNGAAYAGKCFISHSACPEDAQKVAALIEGRFKELRDSIVVCDIGAVIGAHTGPGTVALFFFGDRREE